MVAALGGPADLVERPDAYIERPAVEVAVLPARAGFVGEIDVRAMGLAIVAMGGGRVRADQVIDHAVGFADVAGLGEPVGPDQPICRILARTAAQADEAAAAVRAAVTITDTPPVLRGPIRERVAG